MSAIVPTTSVHPAEHYVRGGATVKSLTMQDSANALLWAIGRGSQLVPTFGSLAQIANGTDAIFKFRVAPRYQAFSRVWTVGMGITASRSRSFSVKTPSTGTAKTYTTSASRMTNQAVMHYEHLAAQSATVGEAQLYIDNDSGSALVIDSIGCFEVPRLTLEQDGNDYGVDMESLAHRQPIYDGTGKSLGGLGDLAANAFTIAQRNGMYHHAWPIVGNGSGASFGTTSTKNIAYTDGSYVPVFANGSGAARAMPQLARKERRDGVTGYDLRTVSVGVLAAVSAGDADVRFTMTNGDTATLNITSIDTTFGGTGAGTWVTGSIDIDTEDAASSNGLRDSTWDMMTIEARKNTSGTLYIAAISVWGG